MQSVPMNSFSKPKRIELSNFSTSQILSTKKNKPSQNPTKNIGFQSFPQANQQEITSRTPPSRSSPFFALYIEPSYPKFARQSGNEGKVKIKASYNQQGIITRIEILESSGFKILDEAVLRAAKDWKINTGVEGNFEKIFQFKLNK